MRVGRLGRSAALACALLGWAVGARAGPFNIKALVLYTAAAEKLANDKLTGAANEFKSCPEFKGGAKDACVKQRAAITPIRWAIATAFAGVKLVFQTSGLGGDDGADFSHYAVPFKVDDSIYQERNIDTCALAKVAASNQNFQRWRAHAHASLVVVFVAVPANEPVIGCSAEVPRSIEQNLAEERANAYVVVNVLDSYKTGQWALAHEVGHVFGAGHTVGPDQGGVSPAAAYTDLNNKFATVMAHIRKGFTRIPEFSHSGKCNTSYKNGIYRGFECGSEEFDNRDVVLHNIPLVAQYGGSLSDGP